IYDHPYSVSVASVVGRINIFAARRLTSSKSEHPEFMSLEGDHRLFAEKADVKKLGAINKNVWLAIRPENISISFGASFPEDNLLKAVVTDVRPRGSSTLVELDSNGLKLGALVLRLVGLNVGDDCMLGLPPDRIHILAD
ncbi:MAG: TOBE domain-containing protein, partial [Candidatus Binatia bacterium]